MQFRITKAINNGYLLKPSKATLEEYSASEIACFKKFDWKKSKVLVITEGSLLSDEMHSKIKLSIDRGELADCILVGAHSQVEGFKHFSTAEHLVSFLADQPIENSAIMVTGTEQKAITQIERYLSVNANPIVLDVDLDAIAFNAEFYREKTRPKNRVMAMVKANAYGHGIIEVAHHLKNKVEYFGVAYVYEGIAIRREGIATPIMVMNPSPNDFELCIAHDLEPEVYSLNALKSLQELLAQQKKQLGIHIEIDTGMNRLGIDPAEVDQMLEILKASKWICVNGIYSHLASAEDEAEDPFNRKQLDEFNAIAAIVESALSIKTIKHVRNSAGTLRYPESPTDMVRLGIGLYGVDSNNLYQDQIKNISVLKTVISQIRTVKQGETIGYNRTFKADRDMTVATIAIGYADGYKRLFSNGKGKVSINGCLVPVVGRVNMDMTMVDIRDCPAKEGDEVIIFNEHLRPTYLAKLAGTIPYEIFTSVGDRVQRSYLLEIE